MAVSKKQHNCRVIHFGEKWWSTTIHLDIDQLRMCYPDDDCQPERKRWFHSVERLLGMPKQLYLESGVQQTMARKYITDKVRADMQDRYGDYLDEHPFEFAELVFVFDSAVEHDADQPLRFADRVMA